MARAFIDVRGDGAIDANYVLRVWIRVARCGVGVLDYFELVAWFGCGETSKKCENAASGKVTRDQIRHIRTPASCRLLPPSRDDRVAHGDYFACLDGFLKAI